MYKFSALALRMKYINRWGLMRSSRPESLAEHSAETAVIAGILGAISSRLYGFECSSDRLCAAAVYHDCSEIITGDMPTPAKYRVKTLTDEYKKLEADAVSQLLDMLPDEIRAELAPTVEASALNEREKLLLKAADKLSALIKCVEEERFGNREFENAKASTREYLEQMNLVEVDYFLKNFLPAHELNLDELLG